MMRFLPVPLLALALLSGCDVADPTLDSDNPMATALVQAPEGAPEGTCWAKDATPAIIETVTEHVLVRPAALNPDGSIYAPASYRTETRQAIVKERSEILFERPCEIVFSPEFVASLQRALSVRGFYSGNTTGAFDKFTLRAIRAYQRTQGLDSAILSMDAARKLGLVAIPRT